MENMVNLSAFKGKTVLVTGHTGFKGSWLSIWLNHLGAHVVGYSLDPYTPNDNFVLSGIGNKIKADIRADINDIEKLNATFTEFKPQIVFHLAAQPLVLTSYEQPVETYQTNVMGTINVMQAIRKCPDTKVAVMITTDKCYENREQLWGYRENEPMGGYDPYSSSKAAAEIAINSWRQSFLNPQNYNQHGKSLASARAGNVIGGGDWADFRIIPDCIKSLEKGEPIEIRSPQSIRPWQHVLEPLSGYLTLAAKMLTNPQNYCEAWNFGPYTESIVPVWDVAQKTIEHYGKGSLKDVSDPNSPHEAKLLALDISKARFKLDWKPVWDINKTIQKTVDWYLKYKTQDVYSLCINQINEYNDNKR